MNFYQKIFNESISLFNSILRKVIYYTYKIDITMLCVMGKPVNYLIFIFAFCFGTFGSIKGLSLEMAAFKYLCFLFAWYLISTSIFIFISFQIPILKDYLYRLLGEEWVKARIGNPGAEQLLKYGGAAVALIGANETGKALDAGQIHKASEQIIENYQRLAALSGRDVDPNSKEYKEVLKKSIEVASRPAKGPLDRIEERAATSQIVKTVGDGFRSWWPGSKK